MKFNILPGGTVKRKSHVLRNSIILFCCVLFLSAVTFFICRLIDIHVYKGNSITHLSKEWKNFNYQKVYDISGAILRDNAFNNRALTYRGYSAFYLAVAAVEPSETQTLLDESIISLRLALHDAKSSLVPQLEYMLGKAYFYKDSASNYHYYADLAILYLNRALKDGYLADDIPEYLGLSYASLGMTMESISAFTQALLTRESDLLLLSIAEQYYNAGQAAAAEQYGYLQAAIWTGMPVLEKVLDIPEPSIHTDIDFDAQKPLVEGTVGVSARIGTLLGVGVGVAIPALRWFLRFRKKAKQQTTPAPQPTA